MEECNAEQQTAEQRTLIEEHTAMIAEQWTIIAGLEATIAGHVHSNVQQKDCIAKCETAIANHEATIGAARSEASEKS